MKEEQRKRMFRSLAETKLKDILHCAKMGDSYTMKQYIDELNGVLGYAWLVNDISDEIKLRIRKIVFMIRKIHRI